MSLLTCSVGSLSTSDVILYSKSGDT